MTATGYRFFTVLRQNPGHHSEGQDSEMQDTPVSTMQTSATPHTPPPSPHQARLREAASALEASFLSVMLGSAGLGAARGPFGGGAGEEQFSSFLVQAYADEISARGGIGLAESLFDALKETTHAER